MMWPDESVALWWGGAAAIAVLWLVVEVALYRRRRKRGLGPEIRINDTTTYREQPGGSRVVTQTTLAKPVHLQTTFRAEGGGSASLRKPDTTMKNWKC